MRKFEGFFFFKKIDNYIEKKGNQKHFGNDIPGAYFPYFEENLYLGRNFSFLEIGQFSAVSLI